MQEPFTDSPWLGFDGIDPWAEETDSSPQHSLDFNLVNTDILDNAKYWSPVSPGDYGSYGIAEMTMASANFFEIGDVGNDAWLNERHMPFGDYADSRIGISGNVMMLFDFESHPEVQRRADPNINDSYMDNDPSIKWAIEEYEATDCSDRKEKLADFIAEAQGFYERVAADRFVSVPDWAIDSISHAIEKGLSVDSQIILESGEASALKTMPVSVTPLPTPTDVKKFYDVGDPYEINASDTIEWIVAIEDGKKKLGPFGSSFGKLYLEKPAARSMGRDVKQQRESNLASLLSDYGFICQINTDEEVSFDYFGEQEDLEMLQATYGKMASEISSLASLNSALLGHRESLLKEARQDAFISIAKKTEYKSGGSVADYLLKETGKTSLRLMTWSDVQEHIDDGVAARILSRIEGRVDKDTYLLQIRKQWGWQTLSVTKSSDLSDQWHSAKARDIPYFLGSPDERKKNPMPTSLFPDNYLELTPSLRAQVRAQVDQAASNWVSIANASWDEDLSGSASVMQSYMANFNSGHRVKRIPAKDSQLTSWLINEMPLTTGQLATARKALAELGSRVVKLRMSSPNSPYKIAFKKLQKALMSRLSSYTSDDKDLTPEVLRLISTGSVDLYFDYRLVDIPKDKGLVDRLVSNGYIFRTEVSSGSFIAPVISFNYKCNDHSDVFNICKGFRPSEAAQAAASRLLEAI